MKAGVSRRRALVGLAASAGWAAAGCRAPGGATTDLPAERARPPAVASDPSAAFGELTGLCDGITGPDVAEWTAHRDAARTRLRALDIGAVIVEPGANMDYLGGPRWGRSERPLLLVLPREGPPTIVGPAFERRTLLERVTEHELVLWREHEDPFTRLGAAFPGLARARIAVCPTTRQFVASGLERVWPEATWVRDDVVLGPCRITKQPAELERLRRANEVTQRAIAAVMARIEIGTLQSTIAGWVEQALRTAGLTEPWVLALVGPAASFPHGSEGDRAVGRGDVVLIDTGGSLHGYRSDITRTSVVGEPSAALRRAWDTVARAQRAALAAVRPGVTTGSVDAVARAVMAEAGYGGDDRYFTHRLGHGIGLEVHEPPYLVGGGTAVLAPGMTMSDEPGLYVPGEFGVRLEDIVLVTDDGAEVFGSLGPDRLARDSGRTLPRPPA